jgi:hypothetical protein
MSTSFRTHEADRRGTFARQGRRSMTDRQLEAYLLSRDALRRIQRTSVLLGNVPADAARKRSNH